MSKHKLFVCEPCHHSSAERPKDQPADGTQLLEQLQTVCAERSVVWDGRSDWGDRYS